MKNTLKKYFTHFYYFYSQLRSRVFIALGLSLVVGILDGFGLAMFLPLLQMVGGEEEVSGEGLGGMVFLLNGLEKMGININIFSILTMIIVFFSLKGVAKFTEQYYNVITQQYFIRKLRIRNIALLNNYGYKSFVLTDSGRIQNTLSGEVSRISTAYRNYFMAVQFGILVFVYLFLAMLTNPQFAILVAIGGGLSNLLYNQIYKKTKAVSKNITSGSHLFQGLLIQSVAFYKYLKATGFIEGYTEKLKSAIIYIEDSNKKIGFYNSLLVAAREPLVIIVVVLVIIIQISFFSGNIGVIVLSLLFFYRSLNALVQMQNHWNIFLNMSGSLENMKEFMKELTADQEKQGKVNIGEFQNKITLDNISFDYGDTSVLRNISLAIKKNQTLAFVGESGSGKTTLVNLIVGLMPPTSGVLKIDGVEYDKLNRVAYQQRIGYITQEPVIFSDNIYNNITSWAPRTPENISRFWESLEKSAISDFVRSLPDQENSLLGNNGVMVSGGQKQRLSIARELFKEIDILVMDEATSALDSETEKAIQENIDRLKGQYTILLIAHRLSTVKAADQVILLKKGEIKAIGEYNTLIQSSKSFRKMVSLQEV